MTTQNIPVENNQKENIQNQNSASLNDYQQKIKELEEKVSKFAQLEEKLNQTQQKSDTQIQQTQQTQQTSQQKSEISQQKTIEQPQMQNNMPVKGPEKPGYEQKLCKNGKYRYYKIPSEDQRLKQQERYQKQTERLNNYVKEKKLKTTEQKKLEQQKQKEEEIKNLQFIQDLNKELQMIKTQVTKPPVETPVVKSQQQNINKVQIQVQEIPSSSIKDLKPIQQLPQKQVSKGSNPLFNK